MDLPGVYSIFNNLWKDCQSCYIISDTHFKDPDLIHAYKDRPNDEELVKLINSKVGREDVLIHLGDVGDINYIHKLKGKIKILICGNHDQGASYYKRQIWKKKFDKEKYSRQEALSIMKELYPNCSYYIEENIALTSPFEFWEISADNRLFDLVFTGPLMISPKLILSHEPVGLLGGWAMNIHGHIHNRMERNSICHYNVCADCHDYLPLNLNQFLKSGALSKVSSIHRQTIDEATARCKKRGYRLTTPKNK